MKTLRSIFFLAMLLITPIAISENDEELTIAILTSTEVPVKRDTFNPDIVLSVWLDRVVIEFNGNFGDGHVELRNMTSNESTSSDIFAQDGDTEVLYLTMSSTSTYSLTITFDDGRYGHIVW